jgi:hypothetical protein
MPRLPERLAAAYRPATSWEVRGWSYGRVAAVRKASATRWEERRGTIEDQQIFGPERDDICACGKYEGMEFHHIVCDRCGVRVCSRAERSRRFGHIELGAGVPHPLADGADPLAAFPVLPARYVEAEGGRQLASVYDSLVLASSNKSRDDVMRSLDRLAEILLPVLEFGHRWGLADAVMLAHGLALEDREQDA